MNPQILSQSDTKKICSKSTKGDYMCDGVKCSAYVCVPDPQHKGEFLHGCRDTVAVIVAIRRLKPFEF